MTPTALVEEVRRALPGLRLIAVDGLPVSGKSTLALRLERELGLQQLPLDDFFLPREAWGGPLAPAVPFPFFRRAAFEAAVRSLQAEGRCRWVPWCWEEARLGPERELVARGPVVVEGCSVTDPPLDQVYDLRVFVDSDRATMLDGWRTRDGERDAAAVDLWTRLVAPSVDLWWSTDPRGRADRVVEGRGAG